MIKDVRLANLQSIADRIFQHVDRGFLSSPHAAAMGVLVEMCSQDPAVHSWVNSVSPASVEKLIACMVRVYQHSQHDNFALTRYIANYIQESGETART